MQAGKLDRKIVIQSLSVTQNASGEAVESYSIFATIWANVQQTAGREQFRAERENAQVDTIFKIRYVANLLPTMRISYDSKYYDISEIKELGRQEGLQIFAQALL
jgi:SPP1 family predicted phage head-tail adaptor